MIGMRSGAFPLRLGFLRSWIEQSLLSSKRRTGGRSICTGRVGTYSSDSRFSSYTALSTTLLRLLPLRTVAVGLVIGKVAEARFKSA